MSSTCKAKGRQVFGSVHGKMPDVERQRNKIYHTQSEDKENDTRNLWKLYLHKIEKKVVLP
jgi:hypothetical protein